MIYGPDDKPKLKRLARRVVELVAAAALLGVALYHGASALAWGFDTGHVYLGALAVVFIFCRLLLRK